MISKREQKQHKRLAARLNILLIVVFVAVLLEGILAGLTAWQKYSGDRNNEEQVYNSESYFYLENPHEQIDSFATSDELVNGEAAQLAQLVIVIDDFGYFLTEPAIDFIEFPWPLTLAVMPGLRLSEKIASLGIENDKEVIIHLPMEAVTPRLHQEPLMITSDMSREKVAEIMETAIRTVPGARGLNNHIGSLATQNSEIMDEVVRQCILHRLHILDSITHPKTVFYREAVRAGAPAARRDVFLDHYSDPERIKEELYRAVRLSRKRGRPVIAIGHVRANTFEVLDREAPLLVEQGVSFLPLSAVMEETETR